jgi:aryl carrier-like protein
VQTNGDRLYARVRAAWADVLDARELDREDNFFEHGGDSLGVIHVVTRLRQELDRHIPFSSLFDHPELGRFVDSLRGAGATAARAPAGAGSASGEFPLSVSQEPRVRVDAHGRISSNTYNTRLAVRLRGPLDRARLARALAAVAARHEALRVRFRSDAGTVVQVVDAPDEVEPLTLLDVASEHEARTVATAFVDRPFDLGPGRLLRAGLLRITDTDHVVVLSVAHVVCDAWSLGVVMKELAQAYVADSPAALAGGTAPSWRGWVLWQRALLDALDARPAFTYWRRRLADVGPIPVLRLAVEPPRPGPIGVRGASVHASVRAEDLAALRAFAAQRNATLYMVVLAALKVVLRRLVSSDDVVVASPFANRTEPGTQDLVGWLSHTLVLRTDLTGAETFDDVLERVRRTTLEAQEHQEIPLAALVERLAPEINRTPTRRPWAYFLLNDERRFELALPGVRCDLFRLGDAEPWAHPGLYFLAAQERQRLRLELRYEIDAVPAHFAEDVLSELVSTIRAAVTLEGTAAGA